MFIPALLSLFIIKLRFPREKCIKTIISDDPFVAAAISRSGNLIKNITKNKNKI